MKIIIFISDGGESPRFGKEFSSMLAHNIKNDGVTIWCIGTPNREEYEESGRAHLQSICSKPAEIYYLEGHYLSLKDELRALDLCP